MVSIRTSAVESVFGFVHKVGPAGSSILTSVTMTASKSHRTVFTAVFNFTAAEVISSAIPTSSMFTGRVTFAFINIVLAMISLETLVTFAGVSANSIHTGSLLTGTTLALVYIHFAVLSRYTLYAKTLISVNKKIIIMICF